MRVALETLALRRALPELSNAQLDQAAALQDALESAPLEEFGVLNAAFHEALYAPAQRPRLLAQIEMLGRAADRLTDEPTLPEQWRLERYITPEEVVIELFGENTVIRTDNQDSFQGPVPQLRMRLDTSLSEDEP